MLVWQSHCSHCSRTYFPEYDELVVLQFRSGDRFKSYAFSCCDACCRTGAESLDEDEEEWLIDCDVLYLTYSWDDATERLIDKLVDTVYIPQFGYDLEPLTFVHRDILLLHLMDEGLFRDQLDNIDNPP